jgi:hypothetical protein
MKKITLATIKRFIDREKKNGNLYVKVKSSFDGMIDAVTQVQDDFSKAQADECARTNNLGIKGVWLVLQSRDYFEPFANNDYLGYTVSNSCGSFIVAMKRLV